MLLRSYYVLDVHCRSNICFCQCFASRSHRKGDYGRGAILSLLLMFSHGDACTCICGRQINRFVMEVRSYGCVGGRGRWALGTTFPLSRHTRWHSLISGPISAQRLVLVGQILNRDSVRGLCVCLYNLRYPRSRAMYEYVDRDSKGVPERTHRSPGRRLPY